MSKRRINNVSKVTASESKKISSSHGVKEGDLQRLERIFELMEKHEVSELEWDRKGERLKLKTRYASAEGAWLAGGMSAVQHVPARLVHESPAPAKQEVPVASPTGASKSATSNPNQKQVVSPLVGTFYRASSPTADPYARVGQTVKRGDMLGIIEAMKVMNEIKAEFPGKIVSILVENAQPVEFGEPLFVIEP